MPPVCPVAGALGAATAPAAAPALQLGAGSAGVRAYRLRSASWGAAGRAGGRRTSYSTYCFYMKARGKKKRGRLLKRRWR